MNLKDKISDDLKNAMRQGDKGTVAVLRMLNSEIKNKEIEEKKELSDELVLDTIIKQIKKRKDSIESFNQGGRQDLADQEKAEMDILAKYLPEQMGEEDVKKAVLESIESVKAKEIRDMGKVMGVLMSKIKGRADNSLVSKIVKDELNKLK